jgi:uncharacterized protein YecE (DUF72 family)
MGLFAGTSGWAYPTWKPGFYPEKWPAKRFLEHYGSRLNSVEVNYTFRATPTFAQLTGWMAAVPRGFRFSFKAPEMVTHRKRLKECGDAVDRFITALQPVRDAGMLGCLLFQLPPNFKADHAKLAAFLATPQLHGLRVCFEFRNVSWFVEETWSVLRDAGAAVCIAESEDLVTPEVQAAPDFACYRLRMAGGYDALTIEDTPAGPLAAEAMLLQAAEPG